MHSLIHTFVRETEALPRTLTLAKDHNHTQEEESNLECLKHSTTKLTKGRNKRVCTKLAGEPTEVKTNLTLKTEEEGN